MAASPELQDRSAGTGPPAGLDPRLADFVAAADDTRARDLLGEILERLLAPVVRDVVRAQLPDVSRLTAGEDQEDVCSGALLRLSSQLWSLRCEPGAAPIADAEGYAATTAYNACHALLRRRFPQRARLRSKARYVLSRHPELGLWPGPARGMLCGLATWRGRLGSAEASAALLDAGRRLSAFAGAAGTSPLSFPELVRNLLKRANGPCRVEELVEALALVLGEVDGPIQSRTHEDHEPEPAADPGPSPAEALEQRDFLEHLWAEIVQLPVHQRAALLLNLRDPEGRSMIALLPITGIASQAAIAGALEFSSERLAEVWSELPKDDEWIATSLGVTRRQVINFRKCARERLARRLRAAGLVR